MARRICTVLVVCVAVWWLYCHVDAGETVEMKRNYLTKLTMLGRKAGLDTAELNKIALLGLISEEMNEGLVPRDQKYIRWYNIESVSQSGNYLIHLLVNSLSRGTHCQCIEGVVDFDLFTVNVSRQRELEATYCVHKVNRLQNGRSKFRTSSANAINNGSKGMPELTDLALHAQCKRDLIGECERGTVTMDPWVNDTLAFQRQLGHNTTIDKLQILGSHNSFNDKADGYGTGDFVLGKLLEALSGGKWDFVWAQQWFTMTDQLNMGVRRLMLDPVYFWGAMRLCHCGATFKWFDDVLHFIEKVLNVTIQFDSQDLGCMPYDKKFEAGIQEIMDWVMYHEEEVVMVMINDEGKDKDWGHLDLIWIPVQDILGSILFTPLDKQKYFPDRWPTPHEIFQLGKRVLVTGTTRTANSYIFADMTVPAWDKDTMKYFTPYPECGGYRAGDWYLVGGESQMVGPIYNGPADEGLLIRENIPYLLQCPVSVSSMDIVSPGLISAAIWTWASGYSYENVSSTQCAAMDTKQNGRWVIAPCSTKLYHACQSNFNSTHLVLSNVTDSWSQQNCPPNFSFFLPVTGYQNWQLYQTVLQAGTTSEIWINLPPQDRPRS